MIDAKELRVNNWVERLDGSQFQITPQDIFRISEMPTNLMPNPIPLAPEVLEACEQVVKADFEGEADAVYYLELCRDGDERLYEILIQWDKDGNIYVTWDGYTVPCEYLHTLQNLYFALTGQELVYTPKGKV